MNKNIGHFKVNKVTTRPYYGIAPSNYKDQRVAKRGSRFSPLYYRTTNKPVNYSSHFDQKYYPNAKFVAPWFG